MFFTRHLTRWVKVRNVQHLLFVLLCSKQLSLFFISADDEVQHGGWMASKTPVREVAGPFQGNGEAHDRF